MKILKNVANKKFQNIFQLSLFFLMLFGFLMTSFSISELKDKYDHQIKKTSRIISSNIQNDIEEISLQILFLSSKIKNYTSSKVRIFKLLNAFTLNKSIAGESLLNWNSYSWINKDDKMSTDGKFGIVKNKLDLSKRDYIRFTRYNPEKIIFGNAVYGILTQRLIMPVALGVFNKHSSYLGTLVYGYDIEKATKRIKNKIDEELYKFVIFRNDDLLFSSDGVPEKFMTVLNKKIKMLSLSDKEVAKKITDQGLIFGSNFNSYYIKPANNPIGIVVIMDSFKFYRFLIENIIKNLTLILVIAILFFILFKILYQRLILPISYLSEYARDIANKNFDIKIQKPINDELHEVFNSLDEVRENFKKEESAKKQLADINKKIAMENLSKNHFFEAICRDIREPLFAIIDASKNSKTSTKNNDIGQKVTNYVNEALQISEDLLDIAQTSSGGLIVNSKKINPIEELKKSIKVVSSTAKQSKIKINFKNQENVEKLLTDPKRLRQILVNILIKVIALTKNNSKISVNCEEFIQDNNRTLRIVINSTFSKKNIFLLTNENDNQSSSDYEGDFIDRSFKQSKDLIKKINGNMIFEQRGENNVKILITFQY